MSLKNNVFALICALSVSACGHYSEDLASMGSLAPQDIAPAAGNDFSSLLASEYMALAKTENDNFDYQAAKFYTKRAVAAQKGQPVAPASLRDFEIPVAYQAQAAAKRERLVAALQVQKTSQNFSSLAKAQTQFDSWLEQLEEGHQDAEIQTCADSFDMAMRALENPLANEVNFTLDFPINASNFDGAAQQKISEAAQFYTENPNYSFTVIGYSNDTTPEAGQSKLAVQRAMNVRDALISQGVPSYQIQAYTGRQQAGVYPAAVSGERGRANIILRLQTNTVM